MRLVMFTESDIFLNKFIDFFCLAICLSNGFLVELTFSYFYKTIRSKLLGINGICMICSVDGHYKQNLFLLATQLIKLRFQLTIYHKTYCSQNHKLNFQRLWYFFRLDLWVWSVKKSSIVFYNFKKDVTW